MAADTKDPQPNELPKGLVIGKDGKPCRTCSSGQAFSSWTSMAKSQLKSGGGGAAAATGAVLGAGVGAAAVSSNPFQQQPIARNDCPADVEQLGRSTWTLLHSIAATYPRTPSTSEQSDLKTFMGVFSRLYPCWVCAEDFQRYMEKDHIQVGSRDEFGKWLCEAHNAVNVKLGKQRFDCSKWEERWRTGWKDGSCD
ncbi:hypothetical protein M426DRAFT_74632 [Hypoxylon sp. CI-4A]|nr:hypothetical protein M426DRAFT_74632 [Hypoxylon sp. CI-4A]